MTSGKLSLNIPYILPVAEEECRYNVVLNWVDIRKHKEEAWEVSLKFDDFIDLFATIKKSQPDLDLGPFPVYSSTNRQISRKQRFEEYEERRPMLINFLRRMINCPAIPVEVFLLLELALHTSLSYTPLTESRRNSSMAAPIVRQQLFKEHEKVSYLFHYGFFIVVFIAVFVFSYRTIHFVRMFIENPPSLGSVMDGCVSMWNSFRWIQDRFTFGAEVVIVCIIIVTCSHRLFGFILQQYVSRLLANQSGAFNFKFGWVTVRLGLDVNVIAIHDFYWMNPDQFLHTPYLLRVDSLLVRFTPSALFNCFIKQQDLAIESIEIDKITIHIEKEKKSGLNLWAAMGAVAEDQEKEVREGTIRKIVSGIAAAPTRTASAIASYNPVTAFLNFAAGGQQGVELSDEEEEGDGGQDAAYRHSDNIVDSDDSVDENDPPAIPLTRRSSISFFSPSTQSTKESTPPANTLSRRMSLASFSSTFSPAVKEKKPPKKKREVPVIQEVKGFGVPVKFSVKRITIRKLHAYAQDFLNADHSNGDAIKVPILEMLHEDLRNKDVALSKASDEDCIYDKTNIHVDASSCHSPIQFKKLLRKKNTHKMSSTMHLFGSVEDSADTVEEECNVCDDGLFLDDLVWRLVGRLISVLVTTNSSRILSLVAAAAANNTIAGSLAAVNTAGSAAVHSVSNYNLFQIAKNSGNAMTHLIASTSLTDGGTSQCQELLDAGITAVQIQVISAKNLNYFGKAVGGSCFCSLSLENQPEGVSGFGDSGRTSTVALEDGCVYWNTGFSFGVLYSLETEIRIRIKEYRMARRDVKICEVVLTVGELMGKYDLTKGEELELCLDLPSVCDDEHPVDNTIGGVVKVIFMLK